MNIDLRTIPSYLITRGPRAHHFDDFQVNIVQAGYKEPHITDCTFNHSLAVHRGMREGKYPFAVYEEDAWPTQWHEPVIHNVPACDMLKIDLSKLGRHGPDWDWNAEWRTDPNDYPNDPRFVRVWNMLSSAAYLLMNAEFSKTLHLALYDGSKIGVASDCAMIPLMERFHVIALKKPLFCQGPESNQHFDKTHWCIE